MLMEIYMMMTIVMIKMEEQLITLKTAKLAKKKGFNKKCRNFFNSGSQFKSQSDPIIRTASGVIIEQPSQSQLQRWIRKKYKVSVEVNYRTFGVKSCNGWYYSFMDLKKGDRIGYRENGKDLFSGFNSYEVALEVGLEVALEFIQKK